MSDSQTAKLDVLPPSICRRIVICCLPTPIGIVPSDGDPVLKLVPKLPVLAALVAASWIIVIGGTAMAAHVAVKLGQPAHARHLSSQLSALTGIAYPAMD